MSRLTNKDRHELRRVLSDMERARAYLDQPNHAIVVLGGPATTTLHFTRASDGQTAYEVNSHYGSDMAGLGRAIGALGSYLATH